MSIITRSGLSAGIIFRPSSAEAKVPTHSQFGMVLTSSSRQPRTTWLSSTMAIDGMGLGFLQGACGERDCQFDAASRARTTRDLAGAADRFHPPAEIRE